MGNEDKKISLQTQGVVKVSDSAELVLRSSSIKTGRALAVEHVFSIDDLIVTGGKQLICKAVGGDTTGTGTPPAKYIEVGRSQTAPAVGQTDLLGTPKMNRLLGSFVFPAGSSYYRLYRTFQAGQATGTIQEYGCFNKPVGSAGMMLNRGTFPPIGKGASDTLQVTAKMQFT